MSEIEKEQYEEISLGNENKLIFFRNWNLWDRLLPDSVLESETIDIVTYNFDFKNKQDDSVYNKLLSLAEKGVYIRLFYSPRVSQDNLIDDIFGDEILCVKLPDNHCKIFASDTKAYIGSANFSLGSNNNYECGFLTENKEVINNIKTSILNNFIWKNKNAEIVTFPNIGDPLFELHLIVKDIKQCIDKIESKNYSGEYLSFNYQGIYYLNENIEKAKLPCNAKKLLWYYEIFNYIMDKPNYDKSEIIKIKEFLIELLDYMDKLKKELIIYYEKYGRYEINS